MQNALAVQVTIYPDEADRWHRKPLGVEILSYRRGESMPRPRSMPWLDPWGGTRSETTHLVNAGGKRPVILIFVDTEEHVNRVLPTLKEVAARRLIVRENVVLEQ